MLLVYAIAFSKGQTYLAFTIVIVQAGGLLFYTCSTPWGSVVRALPGSVVIIHPGGLLLWHCMCTSTTPPAAYGDYFWCCDKLKKLDVSHNRIRALPDCFSDLKRLGTLNASHNYLKELPQSCSWGCINLVS